MRVLAVGAHPDDLEILCGGTLARYVQEGHEVVMCHATRGDRGSFVHTSEEIARIRGGEAQQAAEICGAEYATLGFSDAEINAADRRPATRGHRLVRDARPDVIITHSPGRLHGRPQRDLEPRLRLQLLRRRFPSTRPAKPYHSEITPIYFMETIMGLGFQPSEFVDISATVDTKVAMLEAHESQLTWLKDHDGVDIVEQMKTATPLPRSAVRRAHTRRASSPA